MNEKAAELAADVAQLKQDYETLKAQNAAIIQALKDKVAGGGASAEELQAIIDSTNALDSEVKADIAAGTETGSDGGQRTSEAPTATAQ